MSRRLFVSIDLPEALVGAVRGLQDDLRDASGLNFTDPAQAHVTLKFLGEVEESELDAVVDAVGAAVEDAGVAPFTAEYRGLGVFPTLDYISVVWLGVDAGGEEVTRLHEAIERETTALGFDPEDHEFTPHVTIARMEHAGGKDLVQDAVRSRDPVVGTADVGTVRLTESTLTQEGPVYETVREFPL